MLVLSRKESQRIMIGDSIEITVLEVHGNHVRLGICAPRETPIVREELLSLVMNNPQADPRLFACVPS